MVYGHQTKVTRELDKYKQVIKIWTPRGLEQKKQRTYATWSIKLDKLMVLLTSKPININYLNLYPI